MIAGTVFVEKHPLPRAQYRLAVDYRDRQRHVGERRADLRGHKPLSIREILNCVRPALWDEDTAKLIGFDDLRTA